MPEQFTKSRPLRLGETLIKLGTVDSTNTYAINLLRHENPVEGTVILADYQSSGKGQGGNKWLSEKSLNLLFSIILLPGFLEAEKQFYLSMCISNGLAGFVGILAGHSAIKWPNDILLEGKKVGGVLIENTLINNMLNTSVIGIGLNVNQKRFPPELPDAVSLNMVTGTEYILGDLLNDVLVSLETAIHPLYEGSFGGIRTAYLNRLHLLNTWASYTDASGPFEGRINDVADTGELIVARRNGELRNYGFREIQFA